MERKRSVGILRLGIIEIILGVLLILQTAIIFLLYTEKMPEGIRSILIEGYSRLPPNVDIGMERALFFLFLFVFRAIASLSIFSILLIPLGIFTIKLKSIARRMHFILAPLLVICFTFILLEIYFFALILMNIDPFFNFDLLIILGFACFIMVGIIYFLTRPKVKEQFK
ncbi:MAG: hypothetical protein JSW40_04445 [Candidatus Omnitrophota bacterium]|nr:MAG: hypothetical protein JSW40_04445 [Candidatus Omnitrophota bacterium]